MKIQTGLCSGVVLQRQARTNRTAVVCSGTCKATGVVQARCGRGAWQRVGQAADGLWRAHIKNLRAGGPYTIELRIRGTQAACRVRQVFVGDLWVMGGQSNMQGVGRLDRAPKPHAKVRMFTTRYTWEPAREPVNFLGWALDPAYRGVGQPIADRKAQRLLRPMVKGTSPGLAFARALHARTQVPIGLVPCALGGSSMSEWSPKRRNEGGASLYGAFLKRVAAVGGKVRGVIWYQGCSDTAAGAVQHYTRRMQGLVAAMRRDLKTPRLPLITVQINGYHDSGKSDLTPAGWNSIRDQQRCLPQRIPHLATVTAVDLSLDDGIHISGEGQCRLGERLARAADRLAYGNRKEKPAPTLKHISQAKGNRLAKTAGSSLAVDFVHVEGGLQAQGGLVTGFAVVDKQGQVCPTLYKAWTHGNTVILQTEIPPKDFKHYRLCYGYGMTPVCNLADARGMAALAFGPVPIPAT